MLFIKKNSKISNMLLFRLKGHPMNPQASHQSVVSVASRRGRIRSHGASHELMVAAIRPK